MTDEDILIAAMDADHTDLAAMSALADLLMEKGDARGEGLAVLAQYGKIGRPTDGNYPLYTAYHGGFDEAVVGYGKTERLIPLSAVIDPEWHLRSLPRRWGDRPEYRPNPNFDEEMMGMARVGHSRMVLARVWAEADAETRVRMAFHTAPPAAKPSAQRPDVEASRRWLTAFAAKLRTEYYCSYRDAEMVVPPVTLEQLLERAAEFQKDEEYWGETGRFDGFNNSDDFWSHYAVVTGQTPERTGNFFSCSC